MLTFFASTIHQHTQTQTDTQVVGRWVGGLSQGGISSSPIRFFRALVGHFRRVDVADVLAPKGVRSVMKQAGSDLIRSKPSRNSGEVRSRTS